MVFYEPPYGRCECNPCEHRCVVRALREENARLTTEVEWWRNSSDTGRILRERDEARAEVEKEKLAAKAWEATAEANYVEVERLRNWIDDANLLCDCGAFDTDQLVTRGECPDCRKAALAPEVK